MATYYLIRGDEIIGRMNVPDVGVLALPLLGGGDEMSLMSKVHADNLMSNLSLTPAEALAALGLADSSAGQLVTVYMGPEPVSIGANVLARHLITVGAVRLWQVNGMADDLLDLHAQALEQAPAETHGLLAAVDVFGTSFRASAVRAATGMTVAQALARRNQIATYLEGLGYTETAALRAATTEGAQIVGIVEAFGRTEAQLWAAMVGG